MTEFTKKNDITSRRKVQKLLPAPMMDIGKMPPQAVELEEAVLGAMMLEKDVLNQVVDLFKPESFYKDVNARIYSAIRDMVDKSEAVDIMTVTQKLKATGELEIVGGAFYITQLTNRVASAANAEFHARIVLQKFIQRELIRISSETIRDSYEEGADVFELLSKAERNLYAITEGFIKKDFEPASRLLKRTIEHIEEIGRREDGLSGVPSGFTELDRFTSGWQKTDLVIIAARPGMGKTALVVSMAANTAVDFKIPVAIFSLEMSSLQLMTRLISSQSDTGNDVLKTGKLESYEWANINDRIAKLSHAPLFIDDTPSISVFELKAKARRLKEKQKIELIIIDYLQLMTAGSDTYGNREQEIGFISRSLKALAKELDVPVIALSSLNRGVETRGGDKRPGLADLRDSGSIESDADAVVFVWRPEYYNITEDQNGFFPPGYTLLTFAKHRNGSPGDVKLTFIGKYTKFIDYNSVIPLDMKIPSAGITGAQNNFLSAGDNNNDNPDDQPF